MTGGEVKLLGVRPSPFVIRVRIALSLKGVEYEFLEEPAWDKSELLLKSNPVYKKMPVLIHNGRPICESMIIAEYIDEVWDRPPAILPSDPHARATARFWAVYIDDKVIPAVRSIRFVATEEAKAAAVSQVHEGLRLLEEAFEKCSKGKGFFGGDTIGYIDMALGCYMGWVKTTEKLSDVKLLAKTPLLEAWADRFLSHPVVKEIIPGIDELTKIAEEMQDRVKAGLLKIKV